SDTTRAAADHTPKLPSHTSLTDDTGQTVTADSNVLGKVVDVAPTLSVTISGNAIEGQILTATPVQSSDETETVLYQWQSSADGSTWTDIAGAAANSYTLVDSGRESRSGG